MGNRYRTYSKWQNSKTPQNTPNLKKDANGRRPSRDRLLSATQLSANRSRLGSRTTSPELYQESDTYTEELLEKCDTPPARKPKGQCVQSIKSRSQRKGTDKLTRATTPPTPPSGSAPRAAAGSGATSPVTVT